MIQSTLLLDSSVAMGLPCPELPPTKAIGLRPYLAGFTTHYLNTSPLALLSVVAMRDGTATTICPFTSNEDKLLDVLETRFFMMPPSGAMSLENGLKLCGINMQLSSSTSSSSAATTTTVSSSTSPSVLKKESGSDAAAPAVGVRGRSSDSHGAPSVSQPISTLPPAVLHRRHRPLTAEEEQAMDKDDIAWALQTAIEEDELEARGNASSTTNSHAAKATGPTNAKQADALRRDEATSENHRHRTSTVARRRIIVVTGAVSVLDPSNVFDVVDALAANQVTVDVISLMGAPHIFVELARRTNGKFYCPLNGGGEQLRRQLAECARLWGKSKRMRGGDGSKGLVGPLGKGSMAALGVKRERDDEEEEEETSTLRAHGGLRSVLSQASNGVGDGRNGGDALSNLVTIGFPTTSLEIGHGDTNEKGEGLSHERVIRVLSTGAPSQPLCARCLNPIAVPSVCGVCGLLACALPQIHKAFLSLDEQFAADTGVSESAKEEVNTTIPSILPPSIPVVLFAPMSTSTNSKERSFIPRPRCACCGVVLSSSSPTDKANAEKPGTDLPSGVASSSACRCSGCGGVRCFDCDDFVREALKMCPTCVGGC